MLYLRHVVNVLTIEESMISSMFIPHHIVVFLLSHRHLCLFNHEQFVSKQLHLMQPLNMDGKVGSALHVIFS
jgi:hypothetical protein